MEFIEVTYNTSLKSLEKLLSAVKRPGDFFVSGQLELPMPRVDIEGVGALSFPIREEQIAEVLRLAQRAPYGRGGQTIVDLEVRKVWQIPSTRVRIEGRSWAASFETVLANVATALGCGNAAFSADLYKLLIYDRDGFFLPHRDTEKAPGMFGTLVVTLPSSHRGGELRIRHSGREVLVDTSNAEFSEISYVAFYADCEHEALPVREGHRVCLVYNLIQKAANRGSRSLQAPDYESQMAGATTILQNFFKKADVPPKIAWLFDHQYSPAGLSFSLLKGSDAARAKVLVQAAARAECIAHLGIVHTGESGGAEADYDAFGHESQRSYGFDDDDDYENDDDGFDDSEGDSEEGFTVITVDDSWQYVDEWRDTADRPVAFGPIPLAEGELLPQGALDGEKPDKQRLMEASGNEGASYDRSYHRAALVLWHRSRYADVLFQAGVVAALPHLRQLLAAGSEAASEAVSLAYRMVNSWHRYGRYPVRGPEAEHRVEMSGCLAYLRDPVLLKRFIEECVIASYTGAENAALISAIPVLSADNAAAVLSALMSARMGNRPCECVDFLLALSEMPPHRFPEVAAALVAGIDHVGERAEEDKENEEEWEGPDDPDDPDRRRPIDPTFVVGLLDALGRFSPEALRKSAAEKLAARPEAFDPVTVIVPALDQLSELWGTDASPDDAGFIHLWTRSSEFLLGRSEHPPEPPSDWRQDVKISCSCQDCRELQAFAREAGEQIHRFRVKKERRQHLHRMIDKHRLDMTHATERKGSPQTLVCTKNRRSFERRRNQYTEEVAAMRRLVSITPNPEAASALSGRLQAAIGRSK